MLKFSADFYIPFSFITSVTVDLIHDVILTSYSFDYILLINYKSWRNWFFMVLSWRRFWCNLTSFLTIFPTVDFFSIFLMSKHFNIYITISFVCCLMTSCESCQVKKNILIASVLKSHIFSDCYHSYFFILALSFLFQFLSKEKISW